MTQHDIYEVRQCKVCGADFTHIVKVGRQPGFCGDECKAKANAEYKAKWARENRGKAAESRRRWAEANPEKQRESQRKYELAHKDEQDERRAEWGRRNYEHRAAYRRQWREDNREQVNSVERVRRSKIAPEDKAAIRRRYTIRKYGISVGEYDRMLEAQGGKCGICKSPEPRGRNWAIDHDHVTEQVRGLLCAGCNTGIGHLQDDPDIIRRAADYVQRHRQMKLIEM